MIPMPAVALPEPARPLSLPTQVLESIQSAGILGRTDDELESLLKVRHESVSRARRALVQRGVVCDSGAHRATRRGNFAIVWIVRENY